MKEINLSRPLLILYLFVQVVALWAAVVYHEVLLLFIPLAVVGLLLLLQYPVYLFYLLIASIPWSIEYNFSDSLGTDLPDEPLMLVTAFAVLILAIVHRYKVRQLSTHPILLILALQLCWVAVTAVLSTYPLLSVKYGLAKCWYLLAFVGMPLFLFRNPEVLKRTAIILLASMLLFMFVALFRHWQYDFSFEDTNTALAPFYRNHVNYSALLVLMVPLLIAVRKFIKSKSLLWVYYLVFLVTLAALYFSYARGAWLALIAGLATYWILKKGWLLKSYLFFLAIMIAAVLWLRSGDRYLAYSHDYNTTVFHTDFSEHLVATYQMRDVSTAERYYRWIAGVRMIKDSWLKGFGPSTFYNNYKSYTVPAFKTWVSKNEEHSTVHNYFLLLIIEQGVIGLLLFLFLLGTLFWYVQKIYKKGNDFDRMVMGTVAAILVMICTVNFLSDLIEADKVGSMFYLCVAVVAGAVMKRIGNRESGVVNRG